MWGELDTLLDKAIKLDDNQAWFQVVDRETQWEIIRLNTIDQLFDEGIKSDGSYLPDYSKTSVEVYGKRGGHIQLKESGTFYRSFVVKVDSNGLAIIADTVKGAGADNDLAQRYGIDILGLTEENQVLITKLLLEKYIKYIEDELLQ